LQPIIIANSEYVTLQYLPDKKMLYHTVHKPVNEAMFIASLNAGVDALPKYGISKWLSDDRLNGPLSAEFQAWASNDWIPRAIAGGWKYWANVVPKELAAAGTLAPLMEILFGLGLRLMVFSNTEEAIRWLDKM